MRISSSKIFFGLGLLCLIITTGCRSTKQTVGTVELGAAKARTEFFDSMQKSALQFQTMTARLNAEVLVPGKELSSRVDFKMVKDSAFQLSVQPFMGVEIFRIEFTPDSVKVVDRMNRRYVAENYENLRGQTPIEFNFYNLQSLFINRIFLPGNQRIDNEEYGKFLLKQEGVLAEARVKDAMGLLYTFMADGEEKLLSTFISAPSDKYALQWAYTDFQLVDKQPFPMLMDVQVLVDGMQEGGLKLYWRQVQKDVPVQMDFPIPSKYRRITFAQIIKSLVGSKDKV